MSECTKCGSKFVGAPENPLISGLCRYCQIDSLAADLAAEKAIVDSVWKALGISTYEQAKPYAIDEHVAALKAQLNLARDAAIDYGVHRPACRFGGGFNSGCDCGWTETHAALLKMTHAN